MTDKDPILESGLKLPYTAPPPLPNLTLCSRLRGYVEYIEPAVLTLYEFVALLQNCHSRWRDFFRILILERKNHPSREDDFGQNPPPIPLYDSYRYALNKKLIKSGLGLRLIRKDDRKGDKNIPYYQLWRVRYMSKAQR